MALGDYRNRRCPNGHQSKYKKCCWHKDYAKQLPKRNITEEQLAKRATQSKDYRSL